MGLKDGQSRVYLFVNLSRPEIKDIHNSSPKHTTFRNFPVEDQGLVECSDERQGDMKLILPQRPRRHSSQHYNNTLIIDYGYVIPYDNSWRLLNVLAEVSRLKLKI